MDRVMKREVPEHWNFLMPEEWKARPHTLMALIKETDARNSGVGGVQVGGIMENARGYGVILTVVGGIVGAVAMVKGAITYGLIVWAGSLVGGAVIESLAAQSGSGAYPGSGG